jgi:hypothetical protein
MRPKGMACSHHHFEPITSAFAAKGGEIFGIDVGRCEEFDGVTVPENYPGLDEKERPLSTYGSKWYNAPYYRSDYETTNIPRYLIIQMSIHSGHKCALKATEIASNYADTLFWNEEDNKYDYKVINQKDDSPGNVINYDKNYGSGGWGKVREDLV